MKTTLLVVAMLASQIVQAAKRPVIGDTVTLGRVVALSVHKADLSRAE
ncbi:MAG TPA: hypothetical protein VHU44_06370 [Acidobacteriaceae bacterium]|nr:hypothetical protein [Acidobacteriaceae bacterium]